MTVFQIIVGRNGISLKHILAKDAQILKIPLRPVPVIPLHEGHERGDVPPTVLLDHNDLEGDVIAEVIGDVAVVGEVREVQVGEEFLLFIGQGRSLGRLVARAQRIGQTLVDADVEMPRRDGGDGQVIGLLVDGVGHLRRTDVERLQVSWI